MRPAEPAGMETPARGLLRSPIAYNSASAPTRRKRPCVGDEIDAWPGSAGCGALAAGADPAGADTAGADTDGAAESTWWVVPSNWMRVNPTAPATRSATPK